MDAQLLANRIALLKQEEEKAPLLGESGGEEGRGVKNRECLVFGVVSISVICSRFRVGLGMTTLDLKGFFSIEKSICLLRVAPRNAQKGLKISQCW